MQITCPLIKKVLYFLRLPWVYWKRPFPCRINFFKRAFRLRAGKTKDEREQKDRLEKKKKVKKQPTCCAAIKPRATNYDLFHFCI